MTNRKLFCAAAILSFALSITTFAGDVQTPSAVSPPPPTTSSTAPGPANGEALEAPGDASNYFLTDVLLSVFWLY